MAVDVEGSDDGPSEAKRRKVDSGKEEEENGAEKCKSKLCLIE